MNRIVFLLLCFASDCLAHPGHGAQLIHTHGWDWAQLAVGMGIVAVAAVAIWRWK
jgi:hypothetical protein